MKDKILYIAAFILIIVLGIEGYIFYNEIYLKEHDNKEQNNNTIKKDENDSSIPSKDNTTVGKINSNKEYIYDLEYDKNNLEEAYTSSWEDIYYLKDIKVPFINMNTKDVAEANNELKEAFLKALNVYQKGLETKEDAVDECKYEMFIGSKLISTNLSLELFQDGETTINNYAYTFDLKTGKRLSFKELCQYVDLDLEKVRDEINDDIKRVLDDENYLDDNIKKFGESLENDTVEYYIDETGYINVFYTITTTYTETRDTPLIYAPNLAFDY